MKKEPGDTNVSDALTKPLDEKRMRSEEGAQQWRRKHSDELEVEEIYVTEENCKLFF